MLICSWFELVVGWPAIWRASQPMERYFLVELPLPLRAGAANSKPRLRAALAAKFP